MKTPKTSIFSHCLDPDLCPTPFFSCRTGPKPFWTIVGAAAIGYFAFSSPSLAHGGGGGGGHMSGQHHQGPPMHHGWHYSDPFWGGWYPGYAGIYDSNYSYTPTPDQATAAQQCVKNYLVAVQKGKRRPATHRYIAVDTLRPTSKQLEDYQKKQANAKSAASSGTQMSNRWVPPSQLRCVMVFDTQSKQFVGSGCYVIANSPPKGTVAKYDTLSAEYVGSQAL
jgi:hypothetical protein